MEEVTKASGDEIFLMEKERKHGLMVAHTKVFMWKEKKKVLVCIRCQMEMFMRDIGRMTFLTAKEL